MISKEDVKHIAKLARIGIAKKEEEKFARELSLILDYVEKLKEVNISKTLPTSHSTEGENVTREDLPAKIFKENLGGRAKKLLKLAPEIKNGYLKVKSIL